MGSGGREREGTWSKSSFIRAKLQTKNLRNFVYKLTIKLTDHRGRVKRKRAFEHAQNMRIYIILRMLKVPSGPLLSIDTFYSI